MLTGKRTTNLNSRRYIISLIFCTKKTCDFVCGKNIYNYIQREHKTYDSIVKYVILFWKKYEVLAIDSYLTKIVSTYKVIYKYA